MHVYVDPDAVYVYVDVDPCKGMCMLTRMLSLPSAASRESEVGGVCRLPLLVLLGHQKVPDRLQRGPSVH